MGNEFSKEEKVAFDELVMGFEDALVMVGLVSVYNTEGTTMARTNDTIWRPMPYMAQSYDGIDQTANFQSMTQLSVPATISFEKSVPWIMTAKELRDSLQSKRFGDAAKQRLASDINKAVMDIASLQGSLFVKRIAAAAGFEDIGQCDSICNEQGIPNWDRYIAFSSRDYNNMAKDLANRYTLTPGKAETAYERAKISGPISGFDAFKLDIGKRLAAAAGTGIQIDTRAAAVNYYTPVATRTAVTGETTNVDNRYQTITVNSTTGVVAGDAFTIALCYALHHISKENTGQLKTFRVISVPSSTTLVISPPIISNQGGSDAEACYQNCTITAASNSAITFLNTTAGYANPFWHKDAIEILPGRYEDDTEGSASIMRATLESTGIEVVMIKQYDINTRKTKYRFDTVFGLCMKQPQMAGIIMFSQA